MSQIILDISGGNTHKNNIEYAKQMIDEVVKIDSKKHEIIFKAQLFLDDGINIPLEHGVFDYIYNYGNSLGYKTTSSVADLESLKFLLQYDVPFIKLPNDRNLDWLLNEIPRKIKTYMSYGNETDLNKIMSLIEFKNIQPLICISEYPATIEQYEAAFSNHWAFELKSISDHTTNFGLWYRYQPKIYEVHYVLEHNPNNLDGGLFARVPSQLSEIL